MFTGTTYAPGLIRERCRIELYTATGNYAFSEDLFLNVTPKQDSEENSYSEERMKIFDKYIKYTNRFSDSPYPILVKICVPPNYYKILV